MEMRRCHIVIQETLYEQIRGVARREHRSLSAQIVHYLATAVAGEHEESSAEGIWWSRHRVDINHCFDMCFAVVDGLFKIFLSIPSIPSTGYLQLNGQVT